MPRYGPGQSGPPPKPPRARPRPPAVPATTAPRTTRADVRATTAVKPARPKTPAQGGAVLRRGTFQPDNRKQQAELARNARAEGQRVERVRQAKAAHQRAVKLYQAGNRKGAMALNAHARQMAGLPAFESPGVVGKAIEQTGSDLVTAAVYSPAGAYQLGKGVTQDVGDTAHGDLSFKRSRKAAVAMGKGVVEDVKHPLRHPGYTLLDLSAAASLGAGAVGRTAGGLAKIGVGGERTAGLARALDPKVPRPMGLTSRNRAVLAGQRVHDKLVAGPERKGVVGAAQRAYVPRRKGFELEQSRKINEAAQRAPAGGLQAAGRKLSTPEQVALRSVAEGTPIDTQIGFHRNRLSELSQQKTARSRLEARRHRGRIKLLRLAGKHVGHENGVPVLTTPRLQAVYEKARQVAKNREQMLEQVGQLTPEASAGRVSAPGKLYRGQPLEAKPSSELPFAERRPAPVEGAGFARVEATARRLNPQTSIVERPRTRAEAEARLKKLDGALTQISENMRDQPAGLRALQAGRNMTKRGRRGPTVTQQLEQHAQQRLSRFLDRHPEHPVAKRYLKLEGEANRLRELLGAKEDVFAKEPDYRGRHQISPGEPGSTMDDLSAMYPPDLYSAKGAHYYGSGGFKADRARDERTVALLRSVKGKPDAEVTVYRAVPKEAGRTINPGDWVTPSKAYARLHGQSNVHEGYVIAARKVRAGDLYSEGNSVHEWGWHPKAEAEFGTVSERRPAAYQPVRGVPPEPAFTGGEFRVPHVARQAPRAISQHGQMGGAGSVGLPKKPGSLSHEFTGELQKRALNRESTTKLVAESNLEAQRYGALIRARDQLKAEAHDTPGPHDVPMRMDALKRNPLPAEARQYLDRLRTKAEEGVKLTGKEKAQLGHAYDHVHRELFPGDPSVLTADEQARFAQLAQEGKIKWIDSRLLRGLDKPRPLATLEAHRVARVAMNVPAAINQASKAAILYLKPAYAVPNMVGNAALAIVQQGFGAPANVAHAVRWWHALDEEGRSAAMSAVGEGVAQSLAGGAGIGQKAIHGAANIWSKAVDAPFRWSAFVYEARQAGIRSPAELRDLVAKIQEGRATPDETRQFEQAARKANAAMIDYGRLGPIERDIVRNVIFFYPWVKGSTLYAGHFLREHPLVAAATGQLGKQGQTRAQADLGPVPSYAEGVFKVGGSEKRPLVVNPLSTAILQQPAQVGQVIGGALTGNVSKATEPLNFLTPALGAGEAALTRRDPLTGRELKGSALKIVSEQLTGGLPQVTLARRLGAFGGRKSKLYPMTGKQAVGNFAGGGLVPRTMDKATANQLAGQERRAKLDPVARAREDGHAKRVEYLDAAKKVGLAPKTAQHLPPGIRQAFAAREARQLAYAKAGHKLDQRERFGIDLKLLVGTKKITAKQAAEGQAWAKTANDKDISKSRRLLGNRYFATLYLEAATREINAKGGAVSLR